MSSPSVAIYSAYHRPAPLFAGRCLIPVHAEREIALLPHSQCAGLSPEAYAWMRDHMAGDDTGDHISSKNTGYSEMSVLYRAWKNHAALGSPDYVGLSHYHRFYDFSGKVDKPSVLVLGRNFFTALPPLHESLDHNRKPPAMRMDSLSYTKRPFPHNRKYSFLTERDRCITNRYPMVQSISIRGIALVDKWKTGLKSGNFVFLQTGPVAANGCRIHSGFCCPLRLTP